MITSISILNYFTFKSKVVIKIKLKSKGIVINSTVDVGIRNIVKKSSIFYYIGPLI